MPRNRFLGARLAVTAAAMVGILVVAACEGENLFSVPGGAGTSDARAPEVTITAPRGDSLSAKPLGDSVFVSARVKDNVGVSSVRLYGIAERGNESLGTDTVVDRFAEKEIILGPGVRDTTLTRYLLPVPDSIKETALIVVEATDSVGNVSADTVNLILGGPDVTLLDVVEGQSVQAGLNLATRVVARDPLGIIAIQVDLHGAYEATVKKSISPAADSVLLDSVIPIPDDIRGLVTMTATARNGLDVAGHDGPVTLNVIPAGNGDTIPPRLKQLVTAPERMELQDALTITVTGNDDPQGSGVATVGYTVRGISPARQDTLFATSTSTFDPPRTGTTTTVFRVPTFNVDSLNLPDTLVYEVTTWMRDAAGNCAAATGGDSLGSALCSVLPGGQIVAAARAGERVTRPIVAGKTVLLPSGGQILDAAVDTARGRLYLSNVTRNRLEVFDLHTERFRNDIGVGSEPWGLAFTRDNDSLWVANSGGTNFSVVDLDREHEVDNTRLLTPDVTLFDVELRTGDGISYLITMYPQPTGASFSDRPQFVAVDSFGSVIYSTKATLIAPLGTVRKAYFPPGDSTRPEVKLFVEHANFPLSQNKWALAHIDSISSSVDTITAATDSLPAEIAAGLALYDHVPGYPNQVIKGLARSNELDAVTKAAADLVAQGSDVFIAAGTSWDVASLAFKDTTYVASSGDGSVVAVGEGGAAPVGRVLSYRASPLERTSLTRWQPVAGLLEDASEEVRGLGLNYDGTLGVIRGRAAAYFISPGDLRLQGLTAIPGALQGAGAALDPLHANARTLENLGGQYRPDTHLAFVSSGDHTVDIIDTHHFTRIGRVYIRDVITGPLRAVLPFPDDNAGFRCATIGVRDKAGRFIGNGVKIYQNAEFTTPLAPDGETEDRCVVMKLFATTDAGGVVVVDVRKADVLREHPNR